MWQWRKHRKCIILYNEHMDNYCSVSYMGACSNLLFSACSLCTSGVTFPPTTIALNNGRQSFRGIFWDGQCSRAMVVSGTRSLQLQQEWRPQIGIATCCNMAVQWQLCIYSPPKPCWEKNTPTWRQPFNKNHSKTHLKALAQPSQILASLSRDIHHLIDL